MAFRKDEKETQRDRDTAGMNNPQQRELEQRQQAVIESIDETKEDIREALEEAKQDIPKYNQVVKDYQNQTIDSAREIAENYLDSQKQMINSMQSVWNSNFAQMQSWWDMQIISPKGMADMYTRMARNVADATVSAAKIGNNAIFASMEAAKMHMDYARNNAKEFARISNSLFGAYRQTFAENQNKETNLKQRAKGGGTDRRRTI